MIKLLASFSLLMFGLWGGSYLVSICNNTDYGFAAFLTSVIVSVGGLFLFILSCVDAINSIEGEK